MVAYTNPPKVDPENETEAGEAADASLASALRQAIVHAREILEAAAHLVEAHVDGLRVVGLRILLNIAAVVFISMIAMAIVATSAVLLLIGAANGLGAAFHNLWLGQLVVGGGVLLLLMACISFTLRLLPRMMRKQLIAKYESRNRLSGHPTQTPQN